MHFLEQLVVVPIVHIDPDENRTWCIESLAQCAPNFVRGVNEQTLRAKRLRVFDYVDGTKLNAGGPFIFGQFLDGDHIVGPVDPDHMHQI